MEANKLTRSKLTTYQEELNQLLEKGKTTKLSVQENFDLCALQNALDDSILTINQKIITINRYIGLENDNRQCSINVLIQALMLPEVFQKLGLEFTRNSPYSKYESTLLDLLSKMISFSSSFIDEENEKWISEGKDEINQAVRRFVMKYLDHFNKAMMQTDTDFRLGEVFISKDHSVMELFEGLFSSNLLGLNELSRWSRRDRFTCVNCKNIRFSNEIIQGIFQLPISEEMTGIITVQRLLDVQINSEITIDMTTDLTDPSITNPTCQTCGKHEMTQSFHPCRLSQVLIIEIGRVNVVKVQPKAKKNSAKLPPAQFLQQKIDTLIDIDKYIQIRAITDDGSSSVELQYKLQSVIYRTDNHKGHFTILKVMDEKLVMFDDTNVEVILDIHETKVLKQQQFAYILIYTLVDDENYGKIKFTSHS